MRYFKRWQPTPLDRILNPGPEELRKLSADDLHAYIAGWQPGSKHYIAGMVELQRRQAWSGPVRLSLWLSAIAIVVSIAALALDAS